GVAGLEDGKRTHHVDAPGLARIPVRLTDERLRGEVEGGLRARACHGARQKAFVADAAAYGTTPAIVGDCRARVQLGRADGFRQRVSRGHGAQFLQPQREPGPLETRVSGQEDLASVPEFRCHHVFQGALPRLHNSSRCCLSRRVSIGCQKPSCRKARSWSAAASVSSGPRSKMVSSPEISSMTEVSRMKKPPFTQAPSPCGFSWNRVTASSCRSIAPKRPGGWTDV